MIIYKFNGMVIKEFLKIKFKDFWIFQLKFKIDYLKKIMLLTNTFRQIGNKR